jgi:hypothetical protein
MILVGISSAGIGWELERWSQTDRLLSDFTNKSIDGELVGGMVLYDREGRHLNTSKFNDLYDLRVKSLRAFKRPFLTVRPEMACACFELFDKSQYA